jgi:hypothetical protein
VAATAAYSIRIDLALGLDGEPRPTDDLPPAPRYLLLTYAYRDAEAAVEVLRRTLKR